MKSRSSISTMLLCFCLAGWGSPANAETVHIAAAAQSETLDAELTGEAWELADAAYKAYNQQDHSRAVKLAEQASALEPLAPQLYVLQIYALQQLNRLKEAANVAKAAEQQGLYRAVFKQVAQEAKPSDSEPQPSAGATPSAVKSAASAISAQQRAYQQAYPLASKAYTAYANADYKTAAALAEQAFRMVPQQGDWALLWVDSLLAQNEPYAVNTAVDFALAAGATRRQELQAKRVDIQALRKQQEAQERAERATAFAQQAYGAYEQGNFAQAIVYARQAADADPDNAQLQRLLTTTLAAGDKQQNLEALDRLDRALAESPEDVDLLVQRAYLFQRLHRAELAYADFEAARATGKANPRVALDSGFAAAAAGKKREATA